jgi:predicted dehydrogenase
MNTQGGSTRVSVALVGGGNICQAFHVPCLTAAGAIIKYVVDPDPNALAQVRRLAPGVVALRDIADLPKDAECAIVCTPTLLHARHVRVLCERGIHVLCEKPLACTRAEADALVEIARKNNVVLQVGYYRRFHPSAQRVHTILRSGELGAPSRCLVLGGHIYNSRSVGPSLMDREVSGGGALMDVGVHVIDRLMSWFDALTLMQYLDDSEGGMEANAVVRLEGRLHGHVTPITVLLSRTADLGYQTSIRFEAAMVLCHLNVGHELTVVLRSVGLLGQECSPRMSIRIVEPRDTPSYFRDQWLEFVAQTAGQPNRVSSLQDAVRTTALVEECYRTRGKLALPWEACRMWNQPE